MPNQYEQNPQNFKSILMELTNDVPFLNSTNRNINIVEVGCYRGNVTKLLMSFWPWAKFFVLDDGLLTSEDPQTFTHTVRTLSSQSNCLYFNTHSPMAFPWPREWQYDLMVMDIGSNYSNIRENLAYWRQYAKQYPESGRGIMLVNLPETSEFKIYHREEFLQTTDLSIFKIYNKTWFALR